MFIRGGDSTIGVAQNTVSRSIFPLFDLMDNTPMLRKFTYTFHVTKGSESPKEKSSLIPVCFLAAPTHAATKGNNKEQEKKNFSSIRKPVFSSPANLAAHDVQLESPKQKPNRFKEANTKLKAKNALTGTWVRRRRMMST